MPEVNLGKVVGPVGPQGPTGPEGPQGVQGVPGPKGDPGSGTNPNLLCNWYFANPINQRGKTKYTASGYTIDRYKSYLPGGGEVDVDESGIVISAKERDCGLSQYMDLSLAKNLEGKTLTVSALTTDGSIFSATGVFRIGDTKQISVWPPSGRISCMPVSESDLQAIQIIVSAGKSISLLAVKLELGDHQTLAHKEGDKWVLNEVPDPALELARCQRYYLRLTGDASARPKNVILARQSASDVRFYIPTPVPMRANPTFRIQGEVTLPVDATLDASGSAVAGENGVFFTVEDRSGEDEYSNVLYLAALQFDHDFLELDAEL